MKGIKAALSCLVLAGCGGGLSKHVPLDPALTAFVLPDTVALVGVRMDQVRAAPIYRKLAQENRLPRFGELSDQDMHDLLLISDGKNILAVARGALAAKQAGDLNATEYKGFTLYGDNASVRAAINQYDRAGRGAPPDLMARAQALPADAQIWAVVAGWPGLGAEQLRGMGNWANLDRVLRLVEGASLSVNLRTGLHAAFTADSRTDADAKNLADSLRGLASLARMGVPRKQPELLRAFDAIQVKQAGRVVQVNADIAEDLAEKLVR